MRKLADISTFEALQNQAHANMISDASVFNLYTDYCHSWHVPSDIISIIDKKFGWSFNSDDSEANKNSSRATHICRVVGEQLLNALLDVYDKTYRAQRIICEFSAPDYSSAPSFRVPSFTSPEEFTSASRNAMTPDQFASLCKECISDHLSAFRDCTSEQIEVGLEAMLAWVKKAGSPYGKGNLTPWMPNAYQRKALAQQLAQFAPSKIEEADKAYEEAPLEYTPGTITADTSPGNSFFVSAPDLSGPTISGDDSFAK